MKVFCVTYLSLIIFLFFSLERYSIHSMLNKHKKFTLSSKNAFFLFLEPLSDLENNFLIKKNIKYNSINYRNFQPPQNKTFDCNQNKSLVTTDEIFKKFCNKKKNLLKKKISNKNIKIPINKLISFKNLECNKKTCPDAFGKCSSNNICTCKFGFIDDPNKEVKKFCTYKQKSQIILFIIEFFASFGIGHLLNGRITYGLIKLLCFFCILMIDYITKYCLVSKNEKGTKYANILSIVYYFILIFWQILDISMIGLNKFKDDSNVPFLQLENRN